MEPLYLVSNVHRSGSSLLMQCLKAGGLNPIYNPMADNMNNIVGEYKPNPKGFYQFTGEITPAFYDMYKGNVIKCPIRSLLTLPKGNYKLALNYRNPKEIRMSMQKWTPYSSWGEDELLTYIYDEFMNSLVNELKKRDDFEITILYFDNLINDPVSEFSKLIEKGWPINIDNMIDKIHPELYRNKDI